MSSIPITSFRHSTLGYVSVLREKDDFKIGLVGLQEAPKQHPCLYKIGYKELLNLLIEINDKILDKLKEEDKAKSN